MIAERCHKCKQIDTKINNRPLRTEKTLAVNMGRAGNWRSGLGLAYPHFHEDVSVSAPSYRQAINCLSTINSPHGLKILPLLSMHQQLMQIVQHSHLYSIMISSRDCNLCFNRSRVSSSPSHSTSSISSTFPYKAPLSNAPY